MNKQFVNYKIALALKELGFEEECLGKFVNNSGMVHTLHYGTSGSNVQSESITLAPLYQQVIDWFREKHNICIEILSFDTETILYDPIVRQLINGEWSDEYPEYDSQDNYYTARELAIQKAIEILFENQNNNQ